MKVIINKFGKSSFYFHIEDYVQFAWRSNHEINVYWLVQEKFRNQPAIYRKITSLENLPEWQGKNSKYPKPRLYFSSIDVGLEVNSLDRPTSPFNYFDLNYQDNRSNPILIQMIEEGFFDWLKIVNIPDDIGWYVDLEKEVIEEDYETYVYYSEIIRENHRIWK